VVESLWRTRRISYCTLSLRQRGGSGKSAVEPAKRKYYTQCEAEPEPAKRKYYTQQRGSTRAQDHQG